MSTKSGVCALEIRVAACTTTDSNEGVCRTDRCEASMWTGLARGHLDDPIRGQGQGQGQK